MKILIAEDDPHISVVFKLALEKIGGHDVTHVPNGQQAVDLSKTEGFDLIVLDSMMPEKDGLTACKELKQDLGLDTPIIMLSAKSQISDIEAGYAAGAIGYIQKPFDPKTICDQIEEEIKRSQKKEP